MQVKHTQKGKSVSKIVEPMEPRFRFIFGEELEFISLVFTTSKTKPHDIPESSICFNREGLLDYTQSYGNLKLVTADKMF